jgi:hypothetical protein
MAALALGFAGAALGEAIFGAATLWGMSASSIGWMLGSALGSSLSQPNIHNEGPRLGDLKVQSSAPGMSIPIVYGTTRIAGNIIWSSGIRETAHTQTQDGKGGPSVTTTTYTYDVDLAIALCDGPISGIKSVWGDTQLLMAMDSGTAAAIMSMKGLFGGIAQSLLVQKSWYGGTLYLGDETQLPDPTMEAALGVGNVPAHRGLAYIVLKNFQLEKFGNRIPNFSFEVIGAGYTPVMTLLQTIDINPGEHDGEMIDAPYCDDLGVHTYTFVPSVSGSTPYYWHRLIKYDGTVVSMDKWYGLQSPTSGGIVYGTLKCNCTDEIGVLYPSTDNNCYFTNTSISAGGTTYTDTAYMVGTATVPGWYAKLGYAKSGYDFWVVGIMYSGTVLAYSSQFGQITVPAVTFFPSVTFTDNYAWIYGGGYFFRYSRTTGVYVDTIDLHAMSGWSSWLPMDDNTIGFYGGFGGYAYGYYDVTTTATTSSGNAFSGAYRPSETYHWSVFRRGAGWVFWSSYYNVTHQLKIFGPQFPATSASLNNIVSDLCTRSGLTSGQIDVTQLASTTVDGFVQSNQTSARGCIEPLQKAFFFDAVESDNKLKFVKRGSSAAVTVPYSELVGSNDYVTVTRKQELDLPKELVINYIAKQNAYQQGTQRTTRVTRHSQMQTTDSLPIVFADATAAQIVEAAMYSAWTQRVSLGFGTTRKYNFLEPTDVITVLSNNASYTTMLLDRQSASGSSTFTAVLEDSGTYALAASSTGSGGATQTVTGAQGPTNLQVLDIPILRDVDDDLGLYLAVSGYFSGWSGAGIYIASDLTGPYGITATFSTQTSIGNASTVLANWTGANIFDEINSVTVSCTGTLSNATELQVLNGSNVALIGNEILQFKTATLVSAGIYTLTGLLRGRCGTEWAQSTHVAGDRFVLLQTTSGVQRILPALNSPRYYRAVTLGDTIDNSNAISCTDTAIGAKPLSPVYLRASKSSTGDITLDWIRRARKTAAWTNGIEVPLDETTENYQIDIFDSTFTTLKRTLSVTSPTATYTNAQAVADYGSTPSTIYVSVYQISGRVGRGYPITKTLSI